MKNKVADNPPVAVAKAYDFVLWLVQKVENFPKSHRFTIGERLVANGLDLLTLPGEPFEALPTSRERSDRVVNSWSQPGHGVPGWLGRCGDSLRQKTFAHPHPPTRETPDLAATTLPETIHGAWF